MDETNRDPLPYASYSQLAMFLRTSGSTLSISDALARAVQLWIKTQQEAEAPLTGYQWKCLFLPTGTRLRMRCAEQLFYAEIVGDEIVFRGRAVSPRQMVTAAAGEPRNAWRDLWVRRPQDHAWTQADAMRRAACRQEAATVSAPSPTEAIQLAAKSMSEALQTALLLVDQSRRQAEQQVERRVPKHRRREDQLADECLEN
ncbi:hypothetical protein ACHMW6_19925 [Pseudoduganella sp. UC29_106]|uniref:hypothetical protein n=1 Tax=Pseudoduganella sp. UC29_106 TaxID=3374553 RepID=UPI0037581897